MEKYHSAGPGGSWENKKQKTKQNKQTKKPQRPSGGENFFRSKMTNLTWRNNLSSSFSSPLVLPTQRAFVPKGIFVSFQCIWQNMTAENFCISFITCYWAHWSQVVSKLLLWSVPFCLFLSIWVFWVFDSQRLCSSNELRSHWIFCQAPKIWKIKQHWHSSTIASHFTRITFGRFAGFH